MQPEANPLVKPLVPPTQEQEAGGGGEFLDQSLIEPGPGRGQHDQSPRGGPLLLDMLDAIEDRLTAEEHSGPTAVGSVIDRLMPICRPVAEVPGVDLDQPPLEGAFQEALPQVTLEQSGEQGQQIESHGNTRAGSEHQGSHSLT